jgi:hypothetical protein
VQDLRPSDALGHQASMYAITGKAASKIQVRMAKCGLKSDPEPLGQMRQT